MFWLFYFISVIIIWVCLVSYAGRKNASRNKKTIIGSIGFSVLWPFFVLGILTGYALIFMDELDL